MFDNVAFQVTIGLILVYLLYSLLITIVGEIVATKLGIRARLLRVAIERMLNDGYYVKMERREKQSVCSVLAKIYLELQGWARKALLYEPKAFKESFAGRFYNYPAIKYLGRIEEDHRGPFNSTKPSYLTAEYFSDSLINLLKDKGAGSTDMEKVSFALRFNTYQVQPKTLKNLRNLLNGAGNDKERFRQQLMQWYNETMDRTTGWYKRKMRLILFWLGFITAALFNVDTIRIVHLLAMDKEARGQLVNMGVALSKDSVRYKALTDGKDTTHAPAALDSGFARVTRDIADANTILGQGWNLQALQQRDSIVSRDTPLVKLAYELNGYAKIKDSLDTHIDSSLAQLALKRQQLATVTTLKNRLTKSANLLTGKGFTGLDSAAVMGNTAVIYGHRKYSFHEKLVYLATHILWYSLPGLLLTALALSLGAPFWFDLLSKLVSIRGTGVKPEEKKKEVIAIDAKETAPTAVPGLAPVAPAIYEDITDEALALYGARMRQLPGVKSVFRVQQPGMTKQKIIQANVANQAASAELTRNFPALDVRGIQVPYEIVISGTPVTHGGNRGIISNKSGRNGSGTLGCMLKRTDTGSLHILSCWHVMKGDTQYSQPDNSPIILDYQNKEYAERWAGSIEGYFDYGIAICLPGQKEDNFNVFLEKQLGGTGQLDLRPIDRKDIDNQVNIKYYDALSGKVVKGFIYSDTREIDIDYLDRTRTIKDVLILTSTEHTTISREGNSGSIIFDQQNKAVGMIISGDLVYTYAIKLSHIFSIHDEMKIL